MRRLLLLICALLVLGAIAVPAAGFYYLAFTDSGLRFLIGEVPARIGDVRIAISAPRGNIAHGFAIGRVEIDHHLVHVQVTDIHARVELPALALQTVRTEGASIGSIVIQAKHRTRPAEPSTPIFLPRWLIVNASHAHIGALAVIAPGGSHLDASDINVSAVGHYRKIRILESHAHFDSLAVSGEGTLQAADPLRLDLHTHIDWRPRGQPAWSADASANGDLDRLALSAHTLEPYHSDFSAEVMALTSQWHWLGTSNVRDFDVTRWGGTPMLGLLSGHLVMTGNAQGFTVRGPLDSSGLKAGLFDVLLQGSWSDSILWARRMELTHRASGAHATGAGAIAIVSGGPRLELQGSWRDFRWPLTGKSVPVRSESGEFTVEGTWPYAIHASGMAAVRDLPSMPMHIEGALARDRFTFSSASIDLYGGKAELSGEVSWTARQSWSVGGHVAGLDPGQWRADLPGSLSFDIASSGQGLDGQGDFAVAVRDVAGRLRGVLASGSARLARTHGAWSFDHLHLQLGSASLALNGHLDQALQLRFALSTRDLGLLGTAAEGQLEASGEVHGSAQAPTIVAHARGKSIRYAGVAIEGFETNIDFDPTAAAHESHIEAQVHNLGYLQRRVDLLDFRLHGTAASYTAHLDVRAMGLAAALKASGTFAAGTWRAMLSGFSLQGSDSLHLQLDKPTPLSVATSSVHLEPFCLVGRPASLCADASWSAAEWRSGFAAKELPLATLTAGMTPAVEYGGHINIEGHLHGVAQQPAQGSVRAELRDAQLTHRLANGRRDVTRIGSGEIAVSAGPTSVDAHVGLEAGDVGTISGALHGARSGASWAVFPLRGDLHARTDQLGLVTLYVPDIDRAAGHLDADLTLGGTFGAPLVNGKLRISDGEIDYYSVNLGLRQVGFEALLNDTGVDFSGHTRIGSGTAQAQGHLEWHQSLPSGKVHVQGTNLRVVDVPEAQIEASPTLDFTINGRRIEAAGTVTVPYARIAPADLSGAVLASSDEVVVGATQSDPAQRFEVLSNITLNLTDKVNIDTNGLSGKLTGTMTVRSGYDALTSATGELAIEQGKYTAYARKLDIQKGRLIFSGGPLGNPGIDIRAIKQFPDVTAGVNVRGTLLQPRISFFSDPSLTQSQIASLILSGGSLESTQSRQSGAGYEALAQGGAILAQQLGSKVGIQDVSLESDLTNQTSLVLGRYLSPRLYVSYGVALTEQLNVLKLRYSLGDRWTIKTEVGQARGADLVYTIQR